MDTYRDIIILSILIILSGFFSASETALTSFKSTDLDSEDEGKKISTLLKKWLKNPNEILTGLLLGNNIVNILASSIATAIAINFWGNSSKSLFIVTTIMTIVILIFGEITPKIMAKNNAKLFSKIVITPIYMLTVVFKPIIKILMGISMLIGRVLGVEVKKDNIMITEEDLISFVNVGKAEGIIEEEEQEMIHSIVGLGETTAKEIMTPRTSLFAVEGTKTLDEIWQEMMEAGFSRIPVYEGTIDNVIGVLYIKDILKYTKEHTTDIQVKELVRGAYYVPETKSIIKILEEFKKEKVHIAFVLDEYGGVCGVLTIEDLLEEIVGEIRDEFDTEDEEIKEIEAGKYEIDAMLDVESVNKELGLNLPLSEDYDSLGGLLMAKLEKIPIVGDCVEIDEIKLIVTKVERRRVSKVVIERGE